MGSTILCVFNTGSRTCIPAVTIERIAFGSFKARRWADNCLYIQTQVHRCVIEPCIPSHQLGGLVASVKERILEFCQLTSSKLRHFSARSILGLTDLSQYVSSTPAFTREKAAVQLCVCNRPTRNLERHRKLTV